MPDNPFATKTEGKRIPLDGTAYLTERKGGGYHLWDQKEFPGSEAIASLDASQGESLIRKTPEGKKLLEELYAKHVRRQSGRL